MTLGITIQGVAEKDLVAITKDLVAIGEVGRILGVTRQRADQISQSDPDFPAPAADAVLGRRRWRLWRRKDVERYGKATGRL